MTEDNSKESLLHEYDGEAPIELLIEIAREKLKDAKAELETTGQVVQSHYVAHLDEDRKNTMAIISECSVPGIAIKATGQSMNQILGATVRAAVNQLNGYAVITIADSFITKLPEEMSKKYENDDKWIESKEYHDYREKHRTDALMGTVVTLDKTWVIHQGYVKGESAKDSPKVDITITHEDDHTVDSNFDMRINYGDFFCVSRRECLEERIEKCEEILRSIAIRDVPSQEDIGPLLGVGDEETVELLNIRDRREIAVLTLELCGEAKDRPAEDGYLVDPDAQGYDALETFVSGVKKQYEKALKRDTFGSDQAGMSFMSIQNPNKALKRGEVHHLIKELKLYRGSIHDLNFGHPFEKPVWARMQNTTFWDNESEWDKASEPMVKLCQAFDDDKINKNAVAIGFCAWLDRMIEKATEVYDRMPVEEETDDGEMDGF